MTNSYYTTMSGRNTDIVGLKCTLAVLHDAP